MRRRRGQSSLFRVLKVAPKVLPEGRLKPFCFREGPLGPKVWILEGRPVFLEFYVDQLRPPLQLPFQLPLQLPALPPAALQVPLQLQFPYVPVRNLRRPPTATATLNFDLSIASYDTVSTPVRGFTNTIK